MQIETEIVISRKRDVDSVPQSVPILSAESIFTGKLDPPVIELQP